MWVEVEAVRSTCTSKLCHALAEQHSVKVLLDVYGIDYENSFLKSFLVQIASMVILFI